MFVCFLIKEPTSLTFLLCKKKYKYINNFINNVILTPRNLYNDNADLSVKLDTHHLFVCSILMLRLRVCPHVWPVWPGEAPRQTVPPSAKVTCHHRLLHGPAMGLTLPRGAVKVLTPCSLCTLVLGERPGYRNSHLFPSGLGWLPRLSPRTLSPTTATTVTHWEEWQSTTNTPLWSTVYLNV